jgi:hypothetical protein
LHPNHHGDLLQRATETMIGAHDELGVVSAEMADLLSGRRAGTWGTEQARRYADLRRREQRAHRRYLAAQRWHDAVRRRLLELETYGSPSTRSHDESAVSAPGPPLH